MTIDLNFLDEIVNGDTKDIPPEYIDDYEERAAILEIDGGMNRRDARE